MKKFGWLALLSVLMPLVGVAETYTLAVGAAPQELSLNGPWQFSAGGRAARTVVVPHTWNVDPDEASYRGTAVYERELGDLSAYAGRTARLYFEGVYHTARVSVNGKAVGEHAGGYTPFSLAVTEALDFTPGAKNPLRVEVDNAPSASLFPYRMCYDWAADGGIYRAVSLRFTDGPGIRYVHVNPELATGAVKVETKLWDGAVLASEFRIDHPVPWHFDRPQLYTHTVEAGGDARTVRFGFRELKVAADGFVLNGEKVRLAGLEAMPGSDPACGMAEPVERQRRTMKMLRAANATLTRFHWVQPEATLEACDELGILVQEELSWWQGPGRLNPQQLAAARRLVEEMIEAHYNHPSIVAWGLSNEVKGNGAELVDLAETVRKADASRLVTAVCNKTHLLKSKSASYLLDLPTWNDYTGTWHTRNRELLPGYLAAIEQDAPGKPLLITEAGVCEPSFAGGDLFRTDEMIYHLREWQRHPFVIGYIYFCLNDYRTDVGEEGYGVNRLRRHGLADKHLVPKSSFELFAALASPVEIRSVKPTDWSNRRVKIELAVRNTIPSYTVRGYSLTYVKADGTAGSVALPDLKPGAAHALVLNDINDEYHFEIRRPTGDPCIHY